MYVEYRAMKRLAAERICSMDNDVQRLSIQMAGGRAIFALVLLLITVRGQDDVQNVTRSADEIYAPNPTLLGL